MANRSPTSRLGDLERLLYNTGPAKSLASKIEIRLKLAGISEDPQAYASRILFFTFISLIPTVLTSLFGYIFLRERYLPTRLPQYLIVSMMFFVVGAIIPPIVYLTLYADISQKIETRRVGLDSETPIFSSLFLVYLKSGLNPGFLFDSLSESQAFKFVRKFASYVTKRMKYLGEGVEDALIGASEITPSKPLRELILTYVTAVRTGAPVLTTMESKVRDLGREFQLMASLAADRLQGVAEGYVIWLSSGYITFFLVVILSAIFPTISLPLPIMSALAIFLIPILNLVFIYAVEQTQLRFPESTMKAYKVFGYTLAAGILISLVLMGVTGELLLVLNISKSNITQSNYAYHVLLVTLELMIGLIVAASPPLYFTYRELKLGTGYDDFIVRFLRAVGEGLRAGLSPEAVLAKLQDAPEMGKLRVVLRYISASIKFGIPLKDAFRRGAERIRDFTSRAAMLSLADMLEVGSITPETIEMVAEQIESQIRIRKEYEGKVKILLFSPYIGIVLALIATIILSSSIISLFAYGNVTTYYGPLASAQSTIPKVVYIVSISSMFNSFLAGLLVGKIGNGRVANGFLHSLVLTVLTGVLLILVPHIKFNFTSNTSTTLLALELFLLSKWI
jgi:flagellar protein FlaJ